VIVAVIAMIAHAAKPAGTENLGKRSTSVRT